MIIAVRELVGVFFFNVLVLITFINIALALFALSVITIHIIKKYLLRKYDVITSCTTGTEKPKYHEGWEM